VVLTEGTTITSETLPEEVGGRQRVEDLPEGEVIRIPAGTSLPEVERTIILETLRRTGGNSMPRCCGGTRTWCAAPGSPSNACGPKA